MTTKALVIGGALAALLAATSAGAASMNLQKKLVARGEHPKWVLRIENGTQLTLSRTGKAVVQAVAPGAAISVNGTRWTGRTKDGQTMKVTLQNRSCNVGVSQYQMRAEVTFGTETLTGCAGYGAAEG
jgi:uncharacterized membrane protein